MTMRAVMTLIGRPIQKAAVRMKKLSGPKV